MASARPLYQDPFAPVLLSSIPVVLSLEQQNIVREILDVACSDSKFAQKAYDAIKYALTTPSVVVPTVTSLTPGSATIGDPSFDIHVHGTGFTPESIIVFAGQEEPTTYISANEVSTGVNMDVWVGPDSVPVGVLSKEGVLSATVPFVFQSPALLTASKKPEFKPQDVVKPVPVKK